MEFRVELEPKALPQRITHRDKIFLSGSCFTEHIGSRLSAYKFDVLENPNGILFNPVSISRSIISYIEDFRYRAQDLFYHNELWASWDHHSRFSGKDQDLVLEKINQSQREAHAFLQKTNWLFLTLGSSFVYELSDGKIVANCHKMPTNTFNKRLGGIEEIISILDNLIHRLRFFNHTIKIIFTISPVRHLRDGLVENNRSKAILIHAVHQLVNKFDGLYYFPAYELVIDDLRDYRFYAEDMVHPNYLATDYVWEKFAETCLDPRLDEFMKEINKLRAAMNHKAFNPQSEGHQNFLRQYLEKIRILQKDYPELNFDKELDYFSHALAS